MQERFCQKKQNHQNQFQTSTSESIKAKSTELFKIPHQLVNKLSPAIKYNKIFLAEVIWGLKEVI